MPYYTGTANDYAALRTALFNACVANGWTLATDTLTKGAAVVRATISAANTITQGPGIILQGATGLSGSTLVNPSPITPRFGPMQQTNDQPTWPMVYEIFIFNNPDEVYLVTKFNVDFYYWLAFGVSSVPGLGGSGLWLSAISRGGNGSSGSTNGININATSGGITVNSSYSSGAIFWTNTQVASNPQACNDTIHVGLDGATWANSVVTGSDAAPGNFNAISAATSHLVNQPNVWNSEAVLIRIQGLFWYTGNRAALVVDLKNARYVRIDNYTPGQVITLGSDKWKIFPFYRKNATARNGGGAINHTGTFGWAIRYDGP